MPYLPDLVAFIYQSDSAISKADGRCATARTRWSSPGSLLPPGRVARSQDFGGDIPNTIFGQKLGKNPETNYGDTRPKYDEFESNGDFVRTAK